MSICVIYVPDDSPSSEGGLMLRASPASNAALFGVSATNSNKFQMFWRANSGDSISSPSTLVETGSWQNSHATPQPTWLRLKRVGNSFTSYYSQDAIIWTQIDSAKNIPTLPTCLMAGLFTIGHDSTLNATALYNNFRCN